MSRGRSRAGTLLLLLGAVVVTAAIVALLRYWWIDGWFPSPSGGNHIRPLLGTFVVFAVGGAPVALTCRLLDRSGSDAPSASRRARMRQVLVPNAAGALVGIVAVYLLVWNWWQALALVGGLAVLGSAMCLIALELPATRERALESHLARTEAGIYDVP